MKKVIKRVLSVVLSIAIITLLIPETGVLAGEQVFKVAKTSEFHCQDKAGVDYLYRIQVSEDRTSFQLDMTKTSNGEMTTLIYNQGIATTYITTSSRVLGVNVKNRKQVSKVDFNDSLRMAENTFTTQAYRSAVTCIVPTLAGNHLWYQLGNTSPDVGYMLIGCDWSYRLKADVTDDCATFRDKIIESNSNFVKAGLSDAVALAACIAVMAGVVTAGLTTLAAMGIVGTSAYFLIDACVAEQVAHDKYDVIKAYGTRVS